MTPMTPPAVVTVDVGSGSCRALVFDAAGDLRGLAQREWLYHPAPGAAGGYDFDTRDGWAQVGACVREAMAKARVAPADVAAVTA
ncbi:MAG TPA: hypothetical protein VFI22_02340, partial [Thermomicrobiales bacterium]|nr:hypothetical protein [Thermomicrobiales bacterium]